MSTSINRGIEGCIHIYIYGAIYGLAMYRMWISRLQGGTVVDLKDTTGRNGTGIIAGVRGLGEVGTDHSCVATLKTSKTMPKGAYGL